MEADRRWAAELYVTALRTGEGSASTRATLHLAADVVLVVGNEEIKGYQAVAARITGQWPMTAVYQHGWWSEPAERGDKVVVEARFAAHGAAPSATRLVFTFDNADKITRIEQETTPAAPPEPAATLPDRVRGIVNAALANGTPMVMACSDEAGQPRLSLRGSVQVFSDHELGIWLRNAQGSTIAAIRHNPRMSLLYRDSRSRTTLVFEGVGRIAENEAERKRVFELSPEVEQNHDPRRIGAAVIFAITRLDGSTLGGPVRMRREG